MGVTCNRQGRVTEIKIKIKKEYLIFIQQRHCGFRRTFADLLIGVVQDSNELAANMVLGDDFALVHLQDG